MKKFLKIFIPLFILGALVYQFQVTLSTQFLLIWDDAKSYILPAVPCAEPIPYNLGTFNTQFNVSKSYFLSTLSDAEAIWEKPFGKNLFDYAPTDSGSNVLKINLVYDYRQQATSKLANLGITVKDNRASYDMLKVKFLALKIEYEKEKTILNEQIEAFNQKQQTYEAEVNSWNKKGGAPQKEYDQLQTMRSALEAESKTLQTMQKRINDMVDEINALVVVLNRLASTLNISVDKYNAISTSRGESFEGGVYSSDESNREINIYEFSSREKLMRVLAHELGHALGLPHVDDLKAIMYEFNQSNNETLTTADLLTLKIKCEVK